MPDSHGNMSTQLSLRVWHCYKSSSRGRCLAENDLTWWRGTMSNYLSRTYQHDRHRSTDGPTSSLFYMKMMVILAVYLVSWLFAWWCLWRFCSLSCLLHTPHTCPPALRSRPLRRSPLSVHEDMESLTHSRSETAVFALSHTHITSLTSHSPRTHTLWGSLYEQRVPSRTILCMKTTSRVSLDWQCRWQRLLAGEKNNTNAHSVW